MKIALDYDGTFTEDPELWTRFVHTAVSCGQEVRIVTYRPQLPGHALDVPCDVIYTRGNQKRPYCKGVGFDPGVWIDDMPELIP